MKLHEMSAIYQNIEDLDLENISEFLKELDEEFEQKAINITKVIQNIESSVVAMKSAEKNIADRRKVAEKRVKSIKEYILSCMLSADINKIECPYFKISTQKNPPSVVITNEELIPNDYWRQKPLPPKEVDKQAIKNDFVKNGVCVEGTEIIQSKRLVIK